MSKEFYINENGEYVIENYQQKKTFSSFLSGIAGKFGIPLWAFYVNRGQAVASFGTKNKDNSIMEFYPANKSYQNTSLKGFRTFIKFKNRDKNKFTDGDQNSNKNLYEPFRDLNDQISTKMIFSEHSLTIQEINEELGLKTKVSYFIMPNEDYAALLRRLEVENISDSKRELEILDGMPILIPYGVDNESLKEISQTISAWAAVYLFEEKTPFYRLKASAEDEAQVSKMQAGNFYISFLEGENELLQPLVDPEIIFAEESSLEKPSGFIRKGISICEEKQVLENRFPSAMSAVGKALQPGEKIKINSAFGNLSSEHKLAELKDKITEENYLDKKEKESANIHSYYADHVFTLSSSSELDAYTKQTFMDNIMRGGFPISLGDKKDPHIYHIFSRKHGDLERDYNDFNLETAYYSQGNGNYRDVSQNRRSDNFFNPEVKDKNIKLFAGLIQADGYNPLKIEGKRFYLKTKESGESKGGVKAEILNKAASENKDQLETFFETSFTPGELALFIDDFNIQLKTSLEEFINLVISASEALIEAEFGEGYWVDHWTYTLDLVENYLAVYPEKLEDMLLSDRSYTFYDSYAFVKPRIKKHLLTEDGPRQYNAVALDEEKKELIEKREYKPNLLRTKKGKGEIYSTTLFSKLFTLLINKLSALDPYGVGIEMEADKPGWYDALNGLPGLFGSSTAESAELLRLVRFLNSSLKSLEINEQRKISLPEEIYTFYDRLNNELELSLEGGDNFTYWDRASLIREKYRKKVFYGFSGVEKELKAGELKKFFMRAEQKLADALKSAEDENGLYTMYFSYEPIKFKETGEYAENGLPYIKAEEFKQHRLPNFLEAQVRFMKILEDKDKAADLHLSVLESDLYDKKLDMFRVNGDLSEESHEIGRARAFSPGWLENASIWLHMEYKYLLELLKSGLYNKFYEAVDKALVPFLDPEVYGRSILENSSFIMSSLNSDQKNHGRGYIARLSGSTAEYLNIWSLMNFGSNPFTYENGELTFMPNPFLKSELFTKEEQEINIQLTVDEEKQYNIEPNCYVCRFLGETLLVYHNLQRKNTYGKNKAEISKYKLTKKSGKIITREADRLEGPAAEELRNGEIERIDIYLD